MLERSRKLIAAALVAAALPVAWTAAAAPATATSVAAAGPSVTTPPSVTLPTLPMARAASAPMAAAPATAASAAPMAAVAASAPGASASSPAAAEAAAAPGAAASAPLAATLDGRIQDVKSDVIKLNRDLLVLEEELLFPANTQVALFVSMDVGKMFQLDSVQVKLDDKVVANYLYTALEVEALHRGGVQRVYLGNIKTGSHELVAFFTGKGPHDRDYRRGANVKFDKTTDAKYIELRIQDSTGQLQPEFDVKLWQ
jgi:hypothetical protein